MSCSLLRDVVVIYSSASGIAMAAHAHDVTNTKETPQCMFETPAV